MALIDADSCFAAFLVAGRLDRAFLPNRHTTYVVRGAHASGRAAPVNGSLLAQFDHQLCPSLQLGLTVKDAMALEASFHAQSEALSYTMWVLSGLLGFVRLQRFTPVDSSLLNQLVTSLSKSLAHQTSVSASHTAFICHKHRGFYLSHLPAYFSDVTKRSMLEFPVVFADTLFHEEDVARFLDAPLSSSSLWSQQALVDVASRGASSHQRRFSPRRSPARSSPSRRRRRESGSPSCPSKRVHFDSPVPASALKSPWKTHFRQQGQYLSSSRVEGCLAVCWRVWESWGADPWVVQVLQDGYKVLFVSRPPLSPVPLPFPSYSPSSIRWLALVAAVVDLQAKYAIEPASSSPGYYSRLSVTPKVTGGWHPVIDLSCLNCFVRVSPFHMETSMSVLQSLHPGDWMVSIDLQDAYLQVPVHPESCRFLRFCVDPRLSYFVFRTLASRWLRRSLHVSWPQSPPSYIVTVFGSSTTWTIGSSSGPHFRRSHGRETFFYGFAGSWGFSSTSRRAPSLRLSLWLSRHESPDCSFEDFPDPGSDPEGSLSCRRLRLLSSSASVGLEVPSRGDLIHISLSSGSAAPDAIPPTSPPFSRSSSLRG